MTCAGDKSLDKFVEGLRRGACAGGSCHHPPTWHIHHFDRGDQFIKTPCDIAPAKGASNDWASPVGLYPASTTHDTNLLDDFEILAALMRPTSSREGAQRGTQQLSDRRSRTRRRRETGSAR